MKTFDLSNLSVSDSLELNFISRNLISNFNNFYDELIFDHKDSIVSLLVLSTIRNPHQNNFYLNLCKLILFKNKIKKNNYDVVIVNDNSLKVLILSNYNFLNINKIKVIVNSEIKKNYFLKFIKNLLRLVLLYFSKNNTRVNKIKKKKIKLISTYLLKDSIKKEKYIDRYFNSLEKYIDKKDLKNIFLLPTIIPFYTSKKILNNIEKNTIFNILYQSDFLNFSDYLKSLFYHLKIDKKKIIKKEYFINGISLNKNLNEVLNYKFDVSIIRSLLNYKFFFRLKKLNIDIPLFILWYENQPIDKSYLLSYKFNYPHGYSKGYQGYISSRFSMFNFQPTKNERFLSLTPDEVSCVGKGMINTIKEYDSDLIVKNSPAFRFNYINNIDIKFIPQLKILVLLPLDLKNSVKVLKLIFEVINNYKIDINYFTIKPHPLLDFNLVLRKINHKDIKYLKVENNPLYKCILNFKITISTDSSASMESLAFGRPCIIIDSIYGLSGNSIPFNVNKNLYSLINSSEEMYNEIKYFDNRINLKKSYFLKEAILIRSNFFEKVTKKNVYSFLNI